MKYELDPFRSLMLSVPEPEGALKFDEKLPVHEMMPNKWTREANLDYEALLRGDRLASDWARDKVREMGIDPDRVGRSSPRKRAAAADKLVSAARKMMREREENQLRLLVPETRPAPAPEDAALARVRERLALWARGELSLERPEGSSLHHLIDYDAARSPENKASHKLLSYVQSVIVQNDWARMTGQTGLAQTEGEWRLPFGDACWEFRISGVRVLVFTHSRKDDDDMFWCVYGLDKEWIKDNYYYLVSPLGYRAVLNPKLRIGATEFPRAFRLVHDNIRVACIMHDAGMAREQRVAASAALNKSRVARGRPPLRDHYVVQLVRPRHRVAPARALPSGTVRAPQRGHWRAGTWVHYDDPDSGQVQCANDGGFFVSKTWRRWHFAGDPNRLITKEYVL